MATRIANLSVFPLQYQSHGRLVVRSITKAMLPGSASSTLRDISSEFYFNPMFILNSPMNAFSFFSAKLAAVDYGAGPEIADQVAEFAFNKFHSRDWFYGLSLLVVLETIYPLEESRPRADFLDWHLISNDRAAFRDYSEWLDDYLFDMMIRNFNSMGVDDETIVGMSDREISGLKKELLTGEEEEGESCSICLEEFTRGAVITPLSPCSHRFHNGCIVQWLRNNRTCPICRCKCN